MKRVILESPYSGDVVRNTEYARKCMLDSILKGEAPLFSHLLYTRCLDDLNPEQRVLGMTAVGILLLNFALSILTMGLAEEWKSAFRRQSRIRFQ